MNRRTFLCMAGAAAVSATLKTAPAAAAGDGKTVPLPAPDRTGGKPLMACLDTRHTERRFNREELDLQTLSDILWAAWGINRTDGKHVIPTARNKQLVEVYAVRGDGTWLYDPKAHAIRRVLDGDRRSRFDGSGLILLYAASTDDPFSAMHTGAMFQDVGLYCASAGLANCVKYQNHDALTAELPLAKGWDVLITQSVSK